ncbi:hypothetical protein AAFF_G00241700 [Aldrovandia affinis]|uniref:Uncharacterized protein n=1 Tax=Aldrovandia affinis TaxID=143900 RepID=A0AAD7SUN9_9TELE|nr:hypothetical protein AAFF_G00241700 [Aldrovandia affinis]
MNKFTRLKHCNGVGWNLAWAEFCRYLKYLLSHCEEVAAGQRSAVVKQIEGRGIPKTALDLFAC